MEYFRAEMEYFQAEMARFRAEMEYFQVNNISAATAAYDKARRVRLQRLMTRCGECGYSGL
jgi:hypothetical protein